MMIWVSEHFLRYNKEVIGSKGDTYMVSYDYNRYDPNSPRKSRRAFSCTCPHWQHLCRMKGTICKHIYQVLQLSVQEGGQCLWIESKTSKHITVIDETSFSQFKNLSSEIEYNGQNAILHMTQEVVDAVQYLMQHSQNIVPEFGYNGSVIAAVHVVDVRQTAMKVESINFDLALENSELIKEYEIQQAQSKPLVPPKKTV
jgi:hypothetical protein